MGTFYVWRDTELFPLNHARMVVSTSVCHLTRLAMVPGHATIGYRQTFNTLRPRQNGRHFADDTFKCIFLNVYVRISITISLKFVPRGPIGNIPALVQVMAWRRSEDKPLSEPMRVRLPTHICVTRPQWVNIRPTKFQNLKVSRLVLRLSSPNLVNEDVVGAAPADDAPTTSEWSTILMPIKVRHMLKVLQYFDNMTSLVEYSLIAWFCFDESGHHWFRYWLVAC